MTPSKSVGDAGTGFEVFKIILDKGILAGVLLFIGSKLTKVVEELKSTLVWRNELARERLKAATSLHKAALELLRVTCELDSRSSGEQRAKYSESSIAFSMAVYEASIVLPESTAKLFQTFVKAADDASDALKANRSDWLDRIEDLGKSLDAVVDETRRLVANQWR